MRYHLTAAATYAETHVHVHTKKKPKTAEIVVFTSDVFYRRAIRLSALRRRLR